MCNLIEGHRGGSFIGYKVVAKKDGKYYSVAMGFCYDDYDTIPEVRTQKRISKIFATDILEHNFLNFSRKMIGRTCAFRKKRDAANLLNRVLANGINGDFDCMICRVRITIDLMDGEYGFSLVVGGRKMEILGEEIG